MAAATLVLGATHYGARPVSLVHGKTVKFGGRLGHLHEPGHGVASSAFGRLCVHCPDVMQF